MPTPIPQLQSKHKTPRVCLLTEAGQGNLGDEAILESVISAVRERHPSADIVCLCPNPDDTAARYDVAVHPMRRRKRAKPHAYGRYLGWIADRASRLLDEAWFAREAYRVLKNSDHLIIAGGGQLDDYWGGAWSHPYTLFVWAVAARLSGTRMSVFSVGVCSLERRLSHHFVKYALSAANYVSLRDQGSLDILEKHGCVKGGRVRPDLAFGVGIDTAPAHGRRGGERLIGVSPMAYMDGRYWPQADDTIYRRYIERLAGLCCQLIQQGNRIALFPSQIRMDVAAVEDLAGAIAERLGGTLPDEVVIVGIASVKELIRFLATVDIVIASRLHGLLLASLLARPLLALSYDRKVDALMSDLGQMQYCGAIDTGDETDLYRQYAALESELDVVSQQIAAKVRGYRRQVTQQYDDVFGYTRTPQSLAAMSK